MDNEIINVEEMSDDELLEYLNDLADKTCRSVVVGDRIYEKLRTISRHVRYRSNVDKKIHEKLDEIMKMI